MKFHRPLLAAEMTSNSGTYYYNNETWPLVTIANTQKAGATTCDAAYQPLFNDLQTLYSDHPDSALNTAFGWPVGAGKSWLAVDQSPEPGITSICGWIPAPKATPVPRACLARRCVWSSRIRLLLPILR